MLILTLIIVTQFAQAETLEGVAKNKNGDIVYLENHVIQLSSDGLNKFIRVEYTKPDGTQFATMTSDFSNSNTLPDTLFIDSRFKTKLSLRLSGKSVDFEESQNDQPVSRKIIPYQESMVASQGFDSFLKMNFSKLQNESVDFKFGVLESKDFYSLTGYRKSTKSGDVEFGIKASSWVVRLFASELKVTYDSATKRLKSFSGRSNILDDSGRSQDVTINYQWKSEP